MFECKHLNDSNFVVVALHAHADTLSVLEKRDTINNIFIFFVEKWEGFKGLGYMENLKNDFIAVYVRSNSRIRHSSFDPNAWILMLPADGMFFSSYICCCCVCSTSFMSFGSIAIILGRIEWLTACMLCRAVVPCDLYFFFFCFYIFAK